MDWILSEAKAQTMSCRKKQNSSPPFCNNVLFSFWNYGIKSMIRPARWYKDNATFCNAAVIWEGPGLTSQGYPAHTKPWLRLGHRMWVWRLWRSAPTTTCLCLCLSVSLLGEWIKNPLKKILRNLLESEILPIPTPNHLY